MLAFANARLGIYSPLNPNWESMAMRYLKYCHLRYTIFVPPQRIPKS
jgi:hypothetical protein